MEYRALKALLALVAIPGAAYAETVPGNVPVVRVERALSDAPAPRPGGHWHFAPRPRGWVWGQPGWWGGSYQPPVRGYVLPSLWLNPHYVVSDWPGYGLAEPGWGRRWVRYYDDAVLVDGRGVIHDSVRDVPWGRYGEGPVPAYVGNVPGVAPPYGAVYDYAYDDEVTWRGGSSRSGRQIWAWPSNARSAQGNTVIVVPPGTTTTITIQPQQVVTTTMAAPEYERPAAPVWKAEPRVKEQPRPSAPPRVIGRVPVKKS